MYLSDVQHIGIVGTGMIATSMAVLTTGHGYRTTLLAVDNGQAQKSRTEYDTFFQVLVEKKMVTPKQVEICARYVNYTTQYSDLFDVDVVFECVVEELEVKHSVYSKLEVHCPGLLVIGSVSSAIVVDELAKKAKKYRDRIIVTHPFFPPHLIPYFELAAGADTDSRVVTLATTLLEALDRKPVVLKKSAPGFIGNRLQFALWREALNIMENGIAGPKDIDTCLMYSFCRRYTSIGIFEHFDNGGLQLNSNICKVLFPDLSDTKEVPRAITDKIAEGNTGQKTGVGFYDWREVDMPSYQERVNAPYLDLFNWKLPQE